MRRRSTVLTAFAGAMLTALVSPVQAQQPAQKVQVGVLECKGGPSIGFIVGAVTNLACALRINGLPEDYYIATIQKVGLDIGITESTALAWSVFAPVAQPGRGDIAGTYVGVDAMAAAIVGVGGNVLLGGSNNRIALQPLSVQAETGLIVAAGLESMTLQPGR
ncbi:hypothetical protein ACVWZM_002602 [Bradyrhizobium sp. USDA 4501]